MEELKLHPTSQEEGHEVQAWVPEDFNLDVEIERGEIRGVNMKDTKLISKKVRLVTGKGGFVARRLRNDECTIRADRVEIGSYIETGNLDLNCKDGEVIIKKKLGIG